MRITKHPVVCCLAGFATFLFLTVFVHAEESSKSAAEILKLTGEDFYREVSFAIPYGSATQLSPADLLLLAERVVHESGTWPKDAEHWSTLEQIFEAISVSKSPVDLNAMAEVYKTVPGDSYWRSELLEPLATLWIQRELAAIAAEKPPGIALTMSDQPLPDKLKHASGELQKAWRAYRAVVAPFRKTFMEKSGKPWISFQENEIAFYKVVDDFFHDRTEGAAGKIAQFEWSGMCGTGSEQLYVPQSRMLFMALLRERRFKEAAGALFAIPDDNVHLSSAYRDSGNLEGDFLRMCGLDWEALYAGAILDQEVEPRYPGSDAGLLQELAAHGSPHAARLVAELARRSKPDMQTDYIRALAMFISPGANHDDNGSPAFHGTTRISTTPVPPELQKELLQIIVGLMKPEAPLATLNAGVEVCSQLQRMETKEALQRLLKHPSGKIAREAADALHGMGENVATPATAGPVKFQLFLNGKPLANAEVGWEIVCGKSSTTSSGGRTDANGYITIDRDYFVDPARKLTGVAFTMESRRMTPETPWFRAESPFPVNLDEITQVKATTRQVTLKIAANHPPAFYEGKQMTVSLRLERPLNSPSLFGFTPVSYKLPAGMPATFSALQPGTYTIDIFSPGAARWRSKFTTTDSTNMEAMLEPGSDVKIKIVPPGGNKRIYIQRKLSRDGAEIEDYEYFDYEADTYHGLPLGHYKLLIPASSDKKGYSGRESKEIVPKESTYSGAEREFTIDHDSPSLIDLGEIRMEPGKSG